LDGKHFIEEVQQAFLNTMQNMLPENSISLSIKKTKSKTYFTHLWLQWLCLFQIKICL